MEKLNTQFTDEISKNIEAIERLFPNCITEELDKEKSTSGNNVYKKAINFDILKQMLTGDILEGNEAYEFTWVGKKASIVEANKPINKALRPCKKESVNWDTTKNLYIEGDNLEVLKMLQESYLGKVKMIYIDPPYNTGNDFIYNDDFEMSYDEYVEELGEVDEAGNRMVKNSRGAGRFHSDWCSMIYSRLMVARNLLAEDGVIFISIDDNEVSNLRSICDEVFGESNFIASITRNTNSSKNQSLYISVSHEYCLVYSKNNEALAIRHSDNKWAVEKNNVNEYVKRVKDLEKKGLTHEEITEELKELTKYPRFIDFTNYWYFDKRGLYRKDNLGGVKNGNKEKIVNPLTGKEDPLPPGGFRYNKAKMEELIEDDRIHFHIDGSLPTLKRYLKDNLKQRPKSIMSDDQRPDYSLLQKFGLEFDNPKQLSFMKRILSIFDKDCLIVDFFSGSATTAHAVMQLNAEDGGNRKFIMVQLPEKTDEKSEAYKSGYKNICEIGKERIRRAAAKIREDNPEATFDGGFRVLKVDSSNLKDVYFNPSEYTQNMLEGLESNIKEDRTALDLLFDAVLRSGLELSMSYESDIIENFVVHNYDDGSLVACFEDNLTPATFEAIAKMKPLKAVFKDEGFTDSAAKTNATEIFKRYSPDTKVRVI